jgi:ribosomal protein S18 acetylase RimI-like enzyme
MERRIVVRPVTAADEAAAGVATARAFEEFTAHDANFEPAYLARIADIAARSSRAAVLVALDDGVIAGSVTLEMEQRIRDDPERPLAADEAHLRMLGVAPAHRGRGVARRLVLACIDLASARGKRRLTLDTGERMTAARALYESLGFEAAGIRDMHDGYLLRSYELRLDTPVRLASGPS